MCQTKSSAASGCSRRSVRKLSKIDRAASVSSSVRRCVPTYPDPVSGPDPGSEPEPDEGSACALGQVISHWRLSAFSSVPGPQEIGGGDDGGDGDNGGNGGGGSMVNDAFTYEATSERVQLFRQLELDAMAVRSPLMSAEAVPPYTQL